LSPSYLAFASALSNVSIPKTLHEALSHPGWKQAMIDEMITLESNQTWELVPPPLGKSIVGCRWVFNVKVGPDGQVDRLKARLVAKGYTQVYGQDYSDIFSPIAKMTSVRLFIAMASMRRWPYFSWISRMLSCMVTWKKRFIWSNLLGLLLKGGIVWYAN